MKKIFVSHPFGNKGSNKVVIAEISRNIVKLGAMPVSPVHMFGFLDDSNPVEREQAMEFCEEIICEEIIRYCDELWLCGAWEESAGCQAELLAALSEAIPVHIVTGWDGDEPVFDKERPFVSAEG